METFDIALCDDCIMLIANGGGDTVDTYWCPHDGIHNDCLEAHQAHADAFAAHTAGTNVSYGASDGSDCECWFSHSACDGCNSPMGGTRHAATGWVD